MRHFEYCYQDLHVVSLPAQFAELNAFLVEEGQANFTLPEQGEADEYDAVLDIGAPPSQDG